MVDDLDLLSSIKIKAIKKDKTITEIIKKSDVSRDTFYKRLRRGDHIFYKKILKLLD